MTTKTFDADIRPEDGQPLHVPSSASARFQDMRLRLVGAREARVAQAETIGPRGRLTGFLSNGYLGRRRRRRLRARARLAA